jgi:hypothetical protein
VTSSGKQDGLKNNPRKHNFVGGAVNAFLKKSGKNILGMGCLLFSGGYR